MSIKIDLKIFLFVILFWITKQIEMYTILMTFALIHELGHLICGLILGFKPIGIKINPVGFQIYFKTYIDDYNEKRKNGNKLCIKKILIALAGPSINLLIAFICLLAPIEILPKISIVIYTNLLLAIFNLLPIYPLDGGRMLKEILHIQKGKEKAYEISYKTSKTLVMILTVFTSILILHIHNIAILVILTYLWFLVIQNKKKYNMRKKLYEQIRTFSCVSKKTMV